MATTAGAFSLLAVLLSISAVSVHGAHHHHATPAPAPSADCSSLIMNMADCLSFVSTGSSVAKPEGSCCSGLKTVLKADARCLCEGFKSSASLGVSLNVTKALTLPAACKIHAPSIANCNLSAPTGAPGLSPTAAAGPESAGANALSPGQAPAPSPGSSASSLFPVSVESLISAISVILFSIL